MMNGAILSFALTILLIGCGGDDNKENSPQEEVSLEYLTNRPDVVWGFDFLPDGNLIFTQRAGGIFILNLQSKDVTQVAGAPASAPGGEGGLLDLELHPAFALNNLVYFCYSEARNGGRGITLGRGIFQSGRLNNVQVIFRSNRSNNSSIHFGCRIEFENSGQLFLSLGEQNEANEAQDPNSHLGKILRLNADGSGVEVWSLGHRNVQGLALQPGSGVLYASEHGPTGGDELNIIQRGNNYGWPLVTRGTPSGSLGSSAPGFIDAITTWTPAIAPSGIAFWRGDLYMAALRGQHIRKLTINGDQVLLQEVLFSEENKRFRNLRVGPDDLLYFSTDDGMIGVIR